MELKFDGKTVTGPVTGLPSPGEVKTGTFDPVTGALRLELGQSGSSVALLTFEGYVVNGTATGRVTAPNGNGTFIITKGGSQAEVLTPSRGDAAAAVRAGLTEVSDWVTKAADLVPADKYAYKPTASVRTFGQIIGHIADSYNYYCARAAGRSVQWSDAIEKGPTDKATLAPKLKQALGVCTTAYGGTGDIGQMMANVAHTNLHYGNLITYIRMLGMTPPSS